MLFWVIVKVKITIIGSNCSLVIVLIIVFLFSCFPRSLWYQRLCPRICLLHRIQLFHSYSDVAYVLFSFVLLRSLQLGLICVVNNEWNHIGHNQLWRQLIVGDKNLLKVPFAIRNGGLRSKPWCLILVGRLFCSDHLGKHDGFREQRNARRRTLGVW